MDENQFYVQQTTPNPSGVECEKMLLVNRNECGKGGDLFMFTIVIYSKWHSKI